jgi:DNA polymerase-3 subunit epsilon
MIENYERKSHVLKEALFASLELPQGEVVAINHKVNPTPQDANPIIVTVIDTETASQNPENGIDLKRDSVIELCLVNILVDANTGTVIEIIDALNQLHYPGFKLHPMTTELTGITDSLVRDKYIDEELTIDFIHKSDLILAHNAAFDKPLITRAIDYFLSKNWACSCSGDIDWKAFGMGSKSLKYLLFEKGYFYEAHRASPDVFALIQLMCDMPEAMYQIISSATRESYDVRAINSPYSVKDDLRALGFTSLYLDSVFQYWHVTNISKEDAIILAAKLNNLYGAKPEQVVFKVDKSNKYL